MRIRKRRCRHCKEFFYADYRNIQRQKFCNKPQCQKASKKYSQQKWLNKDDNKAYFKGKANVQRVQIWRKNNPKYWKRQNVSLKDPSKKKIKEIQVNSSPPINEKSPQTIIDMESFPFNTLQDNFHKNIQINQHDNPTTAFITLQDIFQPQLSILIGLISNITGSTLQDDIVKTLNSMHKIGHDIISSSHLKGGKNAFKTTYYT